MKLSMNLHSVGTRIVLAFSLAFLLTNLAILWVYYQEQRAQIVADYENTARSLLIAAEGIRRSVARKWDEGIFSPALLREFAREPDEEKRKAKIVSTVPVAAAWSAMKHAAAEQGFRFKAPRENPRNRDNTPDPLESQALARFRSDPGLKELSLFDEESGTLRYFRPVRLGETCLVCHGDPARSLALWGNREGRDILGYRMDGKKEGDLHGAFELILPMAGSTQLLWERVTRGGTYLLGFTLLLALLALAMTNRILVEPLTALATTLRDIAGGEGDLTRRLEVPRGRTEITAIAASFNRFAEKLQHTVREITGAADGVSGDAASLNRASDRTRELIASQGAEIEQAATAMNEMTTASREVATNVSRTSDAVTGIEQDIAEGSRMVDRVVSRIRELAGEVDEAARVIGQLQQETDGIGAVLDVIREIADQTNLLALNAAIEAARAGEQGRGFAVVADEVRSLASRTQESTAEIQEMIEKLQATSGKAVRTMEQGTGLAEESVAEVQSAGQALHAIRDKMLDITDMASQIASAAEEQSAVGEEINRNLSNIRATCGEVETAARDVARASGELASLAEGLRGSLRGFRA